MSNQQVFKKKIMMAVSDGGFTFHKKTVKKTHRSANEVAPQCDYKRTAVEKNFDCGALL